jgi:serine/threonine protein kinase
MSEIPPLLVEQIVRRRCVLFLGPDAAESAAGYRGLPTSWQLADELANRCGYRGGYRPLPQVAQVCQHARGRYDLINFLRQRLDAPGYQPLPVQELVARIPFSAIVDAGWDRLLQVALEAQSVPYQLIQSALDIPYALSMPRLVLYKPYGSLDRPDSLVITEDDQLNVFYQLQGIKRRLADLLASHSLLMLGYAPDYDSVFVRIYHEIRHEQGPHRPPALVVESLSRSEDARQWEARGITPLVAEPVAFLVELAEAVAQAEGRVLVLPALAELSQAPAIRPADLTEQAETLNRVLETVGVAALVEQSDVPLLSAAQVRDLEAMRAAYERLSTSLAPAPGSEQMWLRQGNLEYARQNYDEARRYYGLALTAHPDLAEAYHNLHYLYLAQGQFDAALDAYRRAVALSPDLALLPPRYTIDAVLGRGGAGVVYRAQDEITGRTVAVKLLDRAYMRTDRLVARYRREAEILQRLQHPHIVGYLDYQQYQGRQFIVMEYLGDATLARVLARDRRLPLDQAYGIFEQACQAISFAHGQHIIHRDIKPANIFLVDGRVKLIDFGLAADLEAGQPSTVGLTTGTVAYMAPEQVAGGPVDERTDIYALGTVFYEMITGRHPTQGAYRPPSVLVPGLNDALDIVLDKARERESADRYPDVEAFRRELTRVIPLQPASHRAPFWQRGLAAVQQGLSTVAGSYWTLVLLVIVLLGLTLPALLPPGTGRAAVRIAGLLLWDMLIMVIVADWFTTWQARRSGYASLAAYGPLLGVLLGIIIGLITHFVFIAPGSFDFRGSMDWGDYAVNILTHTLVEVVVGGFGFLALAGGMRVSQRVHPRLRTWVGIGAAAVVLLLAGLFLYGLTH